MTPDRTDWHHRFGLMMQDFFTGTPCVVEVERDLSVKSQFLDVLIIRKTAGTLDRVLPDGLEGHLVEHNLMTFKSHREPLDSWALEELLGHYVNYRKQVSPSFDDLLPKERFRLFAVCARFPEGLAAEVSLTEVRPGVYEVIWGVTTIRIVVAGRLPESEPNAMLHLFSASVPLLEYGRKHCRIRSGQTTSLVSDLFEGYRVEGLTMPITMEEFLKGAKKRLLEGCTDEELLERISPEKMRAALTPEQRLEGLTPEQVYQKMSPDDREKLRRLLEGPSTP